MSLVFAQMTWRRVVLGIAVRVRAVCVGFVSISVEACHACAHFGGISNEVSVRCNTLVALWAARVPARHRLAATWRSPRQTPRRSQAP